MGTTSKGKPAAMDATSGKDAAASGGQSARASFIPRSDELAQVIAERGLNVNVLDLFSAREDLSAFARDLAALPLVALAPQLFSVPEELLRIPKEGRLILRDSNGHDCVCSKESALAHAREVIDRHRTGLFVVDELPPILALHNRGNQHSWGEEVARAIQEGRLPVRHPETMVKQDHSKWAAPSSGSLLCTLADLNAWLQEEGVPIQLQAAEVRHASQGGHAECAQEGVGLERSPQLRTIRHSTRTPREDALAAAIRRAQERASPEIGNAAVFERLKEMAREARPYPPLLGVDPNGNIEYSDARGTRKHLKLKTLRDRLSRAAERESAKGRDKAQ